MPTACTMCGNMMVEDGPDCLFCPSCGASVHVGRAPTGANSNPRAHWARVAAELQAHRESQQEAWGGIDSVTIGRFVTGEITAEDRERVQAALARHPELCKLTDLVSDVLGACEVVGVETADVLPRRKAEVASLSRVCSAGAVGVDGVEEDSEAPEQRHLRLGAPFVLAASVVTVMLVFALLTLRLHFP
jgi:hypothetical protein